MFTALLLAGAASVVYLVMSLMKMGFTRGCEPKIVTQADEDAAYQLVMASEELEGIPAATMDLAERAARRYRETGRIK